ncbi:MAG: hypothetical protein KTR18_05190 [Acidiferrobacterales bacterium]|nr:hypothetical protein [Acidiferrobacterales bacterium]
MLNKRRFLQKSTRWFALGTLVSLLPGVRTAFASRNFVDPRPEFASIDTKLILEFYFGQTEAADDATIQINAPLVSGSTQLVPFSIIAPGAEKLVVTSTVNPQPLILAMDQIRETTAVVKARARMQQTGDIVCYVLRNGQIGRASRRIMISGHWENN